jgi:hypothetical protein
MNASKPGETQSGANIPLEPLLDEYECSRITGRSVASLRRDRLVGRGISYVKLQALVRYRPCDLRTYIERNLHGGEIRDEK